MQDRFKTKQKDGTENQKDSTAVDDKSTEEPKTSTSTKQRPTAAPTDGLWDKVVIGGNVSLSFGSYTFIYLAPSLGYKFTDKLVAGPGFIYQYAKISAYDFNGNKIGDFTNTVYGPKAFANYTIAEQFYGGLQMEYLNHKVPVSTGTTTYELENTWTPVLFLEAGYSSRIGRKGFAQIGLRYNVLHGPESPYGSPFFPVISFFL